MSFWTDLRDEAIHIGSLGYLDPKKSREQERQNERDQRSLVNAQIKAYQDQTALVRSQLDQARAATDIERRRVNEKQIRTLRRNARAQSASLLGVGDAASEDMNTKLGG